MLLTRAKPWKEITYLETAPAVHYELTNHLGNVLSVITPDASDATQPAIESLTDYYPFGMEEPGRSWNAGDYRFGYTGHEKENDLAEGVYTTEYRLLDTRLGRWLSVDKMAGDFAWMSPYNYCENDPMIFVDPDGEKILIPNGDGKYVDYVPGETKVSDINDEFGKSVVNSLNYLYENRSEKMEKTINDLSSSDISMEIIESKSTHFSVGGSWVIEWNSQDGFISDNGTKLTPANGLYHEMGHAHLWLMAKNADETLKKGIYKTFKFLKHINKKSQKAWERLYGYDRDRWGIKGDEFVIKDYETDAAIQCGEFVPSEEHPYTRDNYPGGKSVIMENELSTTPVTE